MGKSLSQNYIYNLSYQILTLITPLVTTPYLSRVLGAEGIGTYSYTLSIAAYFILLASLGIADYAQREIAYHQGERSVCSRIFYEVFTLRCITTMVSLAAYYIFVEHLSGPREIYWIQALNILALALDVTWFFQGLEEFGKVVFRNFIVKLLNIALIFLLIHTADDLWLYVLLMGGLNLAAGLLICLYLPRYLTPWQREEYRPFRDFGVILQLFLPQIAIQVYTVLDKTMIGMMTDTSLENGYYEQAEKVVKMALMIVTSLGTVMVPRIASAFMHEGHEVVEGYMMRSYRFVWCLSIPMLFGMMAIAGNFVPWFFGPGYEKVVPLLQIFSGLFVAIGLNNATGVQYLIPTKQQNFFTVTVIIGACLNFLLNLYLIPKFYSLGAAAASVVAEVVIAGIQFYGVRKLLDIKKIFILSRRYFFSGIIMYVIMFSVGQYTSASFMGTGVLVAVGIGAYGGMLYLLQDEFFLLLVQKFLNKVKRGSN